MRRPVAIALLAAVTIASACARSTSPEVTAPSAVAEARWCDAADALVDTEAATAGEVVTPITDPAALETWYAVTPFGATGSVLESLLATLPDAARLTVRENDDGSGEVMLNTGSLWLALGLTAVPDGDLTEAGFGVQGSDVRPQGIRLATPLPLLHLPVGRSAHARAAASTAQLTITRPGATTWLFDADTMTGSAPPSEPELRMGDLRLDLVRRVRACLQTSSPQPPWTDLVLALRLDLPLGPVGANVALHAVDPDDVLLFEIYGGDSYFREREVYQLMDPAPDPTAAVTRRLTRDWPLLGEPTTEELDDPYWSSFGAALVQVRAATGSPACVEYLVGAAADGWVAYKTGPCGFADLVAEHQREMQRLMDRSSGQGTPTS